MKDIRAIEPSQTLLINQQSKALIAENRNIYKFGFGESPFMPPNFVIEGFKKGVTRKDYTHVQGELGLRQAIAEFHHQANGIQVSADNIFVAPGSKALIFSVLASFTKADVFIPKPSWVSYAPQAKLAGHHVIPVETGFDKKWRVTPESIRAAALQKKNDTTILILNYPGNPDGLSYTKAEIHELAIALKEIDALVVSDEIYALLNHRGDHYSFSRAYDKTVTTTGLSKWCGAGGWRLGVAMLSDGLDERFREAMIGVGSETYSCAPTPVQLAAIEAYGSYERVQPYIQGQLNILSKVGNYCASTLAQTDIMVHAPEGAFYLLPDFSKYKEKFEAYKIGTSAQMCEKLLKDTGVVLLPGGAFGLDNDHFAARLAYVDFKDPLGQKELDLTRDCPKIIEGIEKICEWVSGL